MGVTRRKAGKGAKNTGFGQGLAACGDTIAGQARDRSLAHLVFVKWGAFPTQPWVSIPRFVAVARACLIRTLATS